MRFLGEDLVNDAVDTASAGLSIRQEADRVLSMVEDLMLVTRHRAGTALLQASPVDLVELAREAAAEVGLGEHRDRAHRLQLALPDEPLVASVDANRVLRALRNLLDNAFTYAPEGPVLLALHRETSTALLTVTDAGPGI